MDKKTACSYRWAMQESKKILKIKNKHEIGSTVKEMMNAFDGLISRLNTAEERIVEHEDISI